MSTFFPYVASLQEHFSRFMYVVISTATWKIIWSLHSGQNNHLSGPSSCSAEHEKMARRCDLMHMFKLHQRRLQTVYSKFRLNLWFWFLNIFVPQPTPTPHTKGNNRTQRETRPVQSPRRRAHQPIPTFHIKGDNRRQWETTGDKTTSESFFFDQCCARHNNCGSHETVLN